jgi:hypothetical protein
MRPLLNQANRCEMGMNPSVGQWEEHNTFGCDDCILMADLHDLQADIYIYISNSAKH